MITYVINTSQNKTLASNLLFDLAGYEKIRWLSSTLQDIEVCADTIVTDQNKLIGDELRVAVILDFYGYDRVRLPYDNGPDKVHVDVYKSFLLAHLIKNLFSKVQKRGCRIEACEVFYIQNNMDGSSEDAANRFEQIARIFSLDAQREAYYRKGLPAVEDDGYDNEQHARYEAYKKEVEADQRVLLEEFETFTLHLTRDSSLTFSAKEYCYRDRATLGTFVDSINIMMVDNQSIIRHIHPTTGEMSVHAAYDNLTLSLYLVSEYESDRKIGMDPRHDSVAKLDKKKLELYLQKVHAQIAAARELAGDDQSSERFYPIEVPDTRETVEQGVNVIPEIVTGSIDVDTMYQNILRYSSHSDCGMDDEDVEELDELVSKYIRARHIHSESDLEDIFKNKMTAGAIKKTLPTCPTDADYQLVIDAKRKEMEGLLTESLEAEYVSVKFEEEKKLADKAFEKYHAAKADAKHHLLGDALLFVMTLLVMIIPYAALQCYEAPFSLTSFILYGIAAGVFGGLLLFSYFVHLLPVMNRMHRAEADMRAVYRKCLEKRRDAFAKLKRRYEEQLLNIETIRYEIRQINKIRKMNEDISENITFHQNMLEAVETVLRGMMSHLDIRINASGSEDVDDIFFIEKRIMDPANRIYRIFSLDNIKKLFTEPKGGNRLW